MSGSGDEEEVGVTAPDPATLLVELRHPASYFLDIVATPATYVVPARADATDGWQNVEGFVGSGPYVIDGTDGLDLVLRANERYVAGPPVESGLAVGMSDGARSDRPRRRHRPAEPGRR